MKKITGSIKYEITINEKNEWDLVYEQNSENDLAAMAIGAKLMELSEQEFEEALKDKSRSTRDRNFFKGRLEKVRAAKFGLHIMLDYLLSVIEEYKKFVEQNKLEGNPGPKLTPEQKAELELMKVAFEKAAKEGKLK